jgi:TPR repeat protein
LVSGSSTITIYIKKEHLDFHRKATSLKIELSNKTLNFPMTNSRVAINRAQSAADNPTSGAVGLDGLIETCNKLTTHPWDNNRKKAGVEWKDIQATPAIEACSAAYDLDIFNLRLAYQLGRAYDKAGNKKTLEFLKYAADNGYSPAAYHYSLLLNNGVYVAKNHAKYLQYLIDSAQSEYIPAKSEYGEYLIKQSPENPEAIQRGKVLLEAAVDNNYNPARYFLAMKWFDGTFGEKSNKRGFDYLTTASYLGHAKSSYFIATMYRDGIGLNQNPAKYLEYL